MEMINREWNIMVFGHDGWTESNLVVEAATRWQAIRQSAAIHFVDINEVHIIERR